MIHRPLTTVHGYPRIGRDRELKTAVERFWRGRSAVEELTAAVSAVRRQRVDTLLAAGIDELPVGDFSLYDHVLDTAIMVGAIPARHRRDTTDGADAIGRLQEQFAMARGDAGAEPLEMTKWFDTNYHYLVPEIGADTSFSLDASVLLDQITEARSWGVARIRPVVVGPVTFLSLAKAATVDGPAPLDRLDDLLEVYVELLTRLADTGVEWIQLDEPILATDLDAATLTALRGSWHRLAGTPRRPKVIIATYFGDLGGAYETVLDAPVDGLAIDLVDGRADLDRLAADPRIAGRRLIAGVVDGRNVWRADLDRAVADIRRLAEAGAQVDMAAASSLLHVPHDVRRETRLDPTVAGWLAFADQKLGELTVIRRAVTDGDDAVADELSEARARRADRAGSALVADPAVRARVAAIEDRDRQRTSPYAERAVAQHQAVGLPELPTTTIGSFPQTVELRRARARRRSGQLDEDGYDAVIAAEIDRVLDLQEQIGLDVLVHGEPERNDMVQYFAEQLSGVVTTEHGWVQSYGSRCVRPPVIVGDVSRPRPMTVRWSEYAQRRTTRPVKGMLTGPVTMLAWSFVRDDQPTADTAEQMALALRDEVLDLEAAGLAIVQVDEPALRETLPLRDAARPDYLRWAVDAFRLTTAGVADHTQIHTHMCYADFGDIVEAITALDADVISLEAARSSASVVADLAGHGYPNEVGPGVWDIHSPRVPGDDELDVAIGRLVTALPRERIWVNPDCGLKTRRYAEVEPALTAMVAAARRARRV